MNTNVKRGAVISASRRFILLLTEDHQETWLKLPPNFSKMTVGDLLLYSDTKGSIQPQKVLSRKNCLSRTYRKKSREIAANIDLLLIVTALPPLFNTDFVDRVLTVASTEDIPCLLVINKKDLGAERVSNLASVYQELDLKIIYTSAIEAEGLAELEQQLHNPAIRTVVLAGISGVGKSTILNKLIPGAERKTAEVSQKTGHGKQTTSMSIGYRYQRNEMEDLLLIDLPGIQSFGVSDLSIARVADSFPEFIEIRHHCEYLDCQHTVESNCAVQAAVEEGLISPTRYLSYLNMVSEIEEAKEY